MTINDIENFADEVKGVIQSWFKNDGFKDRKLTDTPTDDLQVVNKKYVDDAIAALPKPAPFEIHLAWSKSLNALAAGRGLAFNASNGTATRMMIVTNSSDIYTFRNFGGTNADAWVSVGNTTVGTALNGDTICYHGGAFYAGGASDVYQLTDSETPAQTICTYVGTTLAQVYGLASDGTYLYVMTSTTVVKQFTVSGTVLTYVQSITLGTACVLGLHVDGTYIYATDDANPVLTLYKFTLLGATASSQTFQNNSAGFPVIKNIIKGPDGGLWLNVTSSNSAGAVSINYLKKCSL